MNIAVVGTGYVGLVTGVCLSEMGNFVTCVDVNEEKIALLNDGIVSIYEPGLDDLVKSNSLSERLKFTTNIKTAVQQNEILMIAVGTPPNEDGSADLQHVLNVAKTIGQTITERKVIITKSTVPVGTGAKVKAAIQEELNKRNLNISFSVVSNPEFLKEGSAVNDFLKPDRIVVGCEDDYAQEKLKQMYQPFVLNGHRVIFMDILSAELTKYAANAMLATKISFMNEISQIAERVGADVAAIRQGIGTDQRIGFHFIYPGIGYGGSCFPKDVKALIRTGRDYGMNMQILEAAENVNQLQRQHFINKIKMQYKNNLTGLQFGVWGLSFKPETDDIREAPAIDVVHALASAGAKILAFDPIAGKNFLTYFKENYPNLVSQLQVVDDQYEALEGSDALILVTEWKPFRSPDFSRIKKLLKAPVIFDGRNQYDPEQMRNMGFDYNCVGRPKK